MSAIRNYQTLAEHLAMIEAAAEAGRRAMADKGLTAGDAATLFAAIKPAQRAEIMRHYRKDGSVR